MAAKLETEERIRMMQNLFGDQSDPDPDDDDDEEEESVDSEHEPAANHLDFDSDEAHGKAEIDSGSEVEGQGEVEVDSMDIDQAVSEGETVQSSQGRRISDKRAAIEDEGYADSEEEADKQRVVTSTRRQVAPTKSLGPDDNRYAENDDEDDIDQARKASISPEGQKNREVVRNVFGDSDEDEHTDNGAQNELKPDSQRYPMAEEGSYERDTRPEDIVLDEDAQYKSDDENIEDKSKEKPVGPPLDLEVPLRPPPGQPDAMNIIKVSNIMGIEQKAFDPETHTEEKDVFVTDESRTKKRIRLEDNIARYRRVKNRNGTFSYESNARFVQWSDGSIQLLIGNEVLNTSVQDAHHDQAHLFLRHGKGILQSQGRLLRKMGFMPSSLSSKSHRLLTAIVDSHHKKVYKVKNCITEIDPEKEKEDKEKVADQSIRAHELLHRKKEKVNSKYGQTTTTRRRQLSAGYLEDALDEEEEPEDYHRSRRPQAHRLFNADLEAEAEREKRITNAKRQQGATNFRPKPSFNRRSRPLVEADRGSEREESEYELDGKDIDHEDEYDLEEVDAEPSEAEEEEETEGYSQKHNEIKSDEDILATTTIRRKKVVFDSDVD